MSLKRVVSAAEAVGVAVVTTDTMVQLGCTYYDRDVVVYGWGGKELSEAIGLELGMVS